MNWLLKEIGLPRSEYLASDFSVRIELLVREAVDIVYKRLGTCLHFGGEYIGEKWQGIAVRIPQRAGA